MTYSRLDISKVDLALFILREIYLNVYYYVYESIYSLHKHEHHTVSRMGDKHELKHLTVISIESHAKTETHRTCSDS